MISEFVAWALRHRRRWRVSGTSMNPTLADGELVLIEPVGVRRFRAVSAGDIVVARHPFKNVEVVKFVDVVHHDDHLSLRSPSGDDSRQFGRVPLSSVRGRVTWSLTRRTRPG